MRILKQKAIPKTVSNPFVERFYGFRQYFLTVLCVKLINELLYRNGILIHSRYMYSTILNSNKKVYFHTYLIS